MGDALGPVPVRLTWLGRRRRGRRTAVDRVVGTLAVAALATGVAAVLLVLAGRVLLVLSSILGARPEGAPDPPRPGGWLAWLWSSGREEFGSVTAIAVLATPALLAVAAGSVVLVTGRRAGTLRRAPAGLVALGLGA